MYDPVKRVWIWHYDDGEQQLDFVVENGELIRFRVVALQYNRVESGVRERESRCREQHNRDIRGEVRGERRGSRCMERNDDSWTETNAHIEYRRAGSGDQQSAQLQCGYPRRARHSSQPDVHYHILLQLLVVDFIARRYQLRRSRPHQVVDSRRIGVFVQQAAF